MDNADILGIAGIIVGVAGLGFAMYQGTERKKLQDYVRSQAWYLHSMANNATGIIQHSFEAYKTSHSAHLDPGVLELLSKSDAFAVDMFKETIRQIQLAEPEFDSAAIDRWVTEGKVTLDHKPLFSQLAIEKSLRRHTTA